LPRTTITTLQSNTHVVLGELHLVFGAATAPRETPKARLVLTTFAPKILSDLKHLVRRDLSAIEDIPTLTELLQTYRRIAEVIELILERQKSTPSPKLLELLGTPEQLEAIVEAVEEKIEDLEIATNPEVHAAIESLIVEVTSP